MRRHEGGSSTSFGRSRGGFTSKIHCLGDARGRPSAFDLTPGEAADCKSYDALIDLPEARCSLSEMTRNGPPKSNRKARSATASDGFRLLDGVDCNVKVEIGPGIPLVAQTVVALRPLLAVGLDFNDTSASAASPAGHACFARLRCPSARTSQICSQNCNDCLRPSRAARPWPRPQFE